jgi:hypothetical protein
LKSLVKLLGRVEAKATPERDRAIGGRKTCRQKAFSNCKYSLDTFSCVPKSTDLGEHRDTRDVFLIDILVNIVEETIQRRSLPVISRTRDDIATKLFAIAIEESQTAFKKELDTFYADFVAFGKPRMDLVRRRELDPRCPLRTAWAMASCLG